MLSIAINVKALRIGPKSHVNGHGREIPMKIFGDNVIPTDHELFTRVYVLTL